MIKHATGFKSMPKVYIHSPIIEELYPVIYWDVVQGAQCMLLDSHGALYRTVDTWPVFKARYSPLLVGVKYKANLDAFFKVVEQLMME